MERHVMWTSEQGPALEHLHLTATPAGIVADGLIVGVAEGAPVRVRYTIACDARWRMSALDLVSLADDRRKLHLRLNAADRWTTAHGEPLPALTGCLEVDISATPFTNTLPIRRLALRPGESRDVPAAYIDVADFSITPVPQRYTCLEARSDGALYLYEGLQWDFRAELPVDGDGLVTDYPGLFKRVWG